LRFKQRREIFLIRREQGIGVGLIDLDRLAQRRLGRCGLSDGFQE
jgi:hypothetical protein